MVLPPSFYSRPDVVSIARELLGKVLVTNFDGLYAAGMITETEAYAGATDRASHAYGNRRTKRTEIMYAAGGVAYVYLCYGIHHLFNVVTNVRDIPHAVLIRAVQPLDGAEIMLQRRQKEKISPNLTSGPGAMSMALGISTGHTGVSLAGPEIQIEDRGFTLNSDNIVAATRVGVAYAMDDAMRPYRFFIANNSFVSKARGL